MDVSVFSMKPWALSMRSSRLWRLNPWQAAPACRDWAPNSGESQRPSHSTHSGDLTSFKQICVSVYIHTAVTLHVCSGLSQGWFSGWRWRRLSACSGASVKVTPSSATQKWTRAWPISTRYANFECEWTPPTKWF